MKNIFEATIGFLVLVIAITFFTFAYKESHTKSFKNNISLIAKFSQVDGITAGSDVRISGIKVGTVTKEFLDIDSFRAILELSVEKNIKLPVDSSVQIVSDGLLGGKYISISAGSDDKTLQNGDEIKYTQSSVNIETLIGKMIFNNQDKNTK